MRAGDPAALAGSGSRRASISHLRVLVVAGTHVRRSRLTRILQDSGVAVVTSARNAPEALSEVAAARADVVLLDLSPHAGGIEVVEQIMARYPVPIVLTGSAATDPSDALSAGAVDIVSPRVEQSGARPYAEALARHLVVASRVRVITHPRGRLRERGWASSPTPVASSASPGAFAPVPATRTGRSVPGGAPLVVIGASTGGPSALASVLQALPADLGAAIVVIQHMADGFVESLASWLDGLVDFPVRVAVDGERLSAGTALIAPSEVNLELDHGGRVRLLSAPANQLHVPGIDQTFASVARIYRARAVGVLLTGMGRDGAAGLLAMRNVGAFTIAQDEATSAVWGMPGAALELDAATVELPLPSIAESVATAVRRIDAEAAS